MDNPEMESMNVDQGADAIASLLGDHEEAEQEEPQEELQEVESEDSDVSEDAEEDFEESESEPEEQEQQIESVADLAEALGLTQEEVLNTLTDQITVQGEQSTVTLKELRDGYQRDADYRRKTMEVAEERKQVQQERELYYKELEAQHMQLGRVAQELEHMVLGGVNEQQLQELRHSDPAEYAAQLQDYQRKANLFNQLRQQAAQQWDVNQQHQQQQLQAYIQDQAQKLFDALPDWGAQTKSQLEDYLVSEGFQPEEIGQVVDHRHVLLARKAMLYDQAQAKGDQLKEVAKKKVKDLPRLQKPSKQRSQAQIKGSQVAGLRNRFNKKPTARNAAAVIENFL